MAVPRDYAYDEEQEMLKSAVKRFVSDTEPLSSLRASLAGTEDPHFGDTRLGYFDVDAWAKMTSLGWQALALPEQAGGADMGLVSAVAVVEEVGFGAMPSPLSVTLESSFLLREMNSEAALKVSRRIVDGEAFTWGFMTSEGSLDVSVNGVQENEGVLNGAVHFVQDLQKCKALLLPATNSGRTAWFVVDLDSPGTSIKRDRIVDLTRDQGTVLLENVHATQLSDYLPDNQVYQRARPALLTLISADIAGSAEWMLQTTVEYAKTRIQFDRPIGFFQAVKHPLVDVMVQIDGTRSLVYAAAATFDHERERALPAALLAKASASETAEFSANRGTQLHGGIGFTWESDVQIYHKRLIHSQHLLGDGMHHRRELAALL